MVLPASPNYRVVEWLGIPYVVGGRDLKIGLNCLGLTIEFLRTEAGYPIPDEAAQTRGEVSPAFWRCWEQRPLLERPQDFDVLVVPGLADAPHVGVAIRGGRRVLSTFQGTGSLQVAYEEFTRHGILGVYRWRGI